MYRCNSQTGLYTRVIASAFLPLPGLPTGVRLWDLHLGVHPQWHGEYALGGLARHGLHLLWSWLSEAVACWKVQRVVKHSCHPPKLQKSTVLALTEALLLAHPVLGSVCLAGLIAVTEGSFQGLAKALQTTRKQLYSLR